MKKKEGLIKLILSSFCVIMSFNVCSETLIFNGKDRYVNDDSPLGVKIYRGSKEQKKNDLINEKNKGKEINTDVSKIESLNANDSILIRDYDLSNIKNVDSILSINRNKTFYWSIKYDETYLNTKGEWKLDENKNIILNTNPKPKDIMFEYVKSIEDDQMSETQRLGDGDLIVNVMQPDGSDFEKKPVSGVTVSCLGMYGLVQSITDIKGNATCKRAGFPIRKITLKAKNIENYTYWNNPKFKGTYWGFEFDELSAHTGYQFNDEVFKVSGNSLIWDGRSIGARNDWIYK